MTNAQLYALQGTLDRLRAGDLSAADELFRIAYTQLALIVKRKKLAFPGLDRWERTGDIIQETALRLHQALSRDPPETALAFFSLAARITRCVLIDWLRHYYGPEGTGAHHGSSAGQARDSETTAPAHDPACSTFDPASLAELTEIHRRIEALPEDLRKVVDLLLYQDMTIPQAAQLLNWSVSTVKRRWLEARLQLAECLK